MLAKIIPLIALMASVRGELPTSRGAPYAPAGWQPRVPFNLPNEYFAPIRTDQGSGVKITKERVEHAGRIDTPQSSYLPPSHSLLDVPEEEGLPNSNLGNSPNRNSLRPSNQYGAPNPDPNPAFKIIYPDDEESSTSDSANQRQSNVREGRYYIVSKDNKIQRVSFRALQKVDDDDDFTAQLRYSTVGQLQDPVYRYNSQGQLERVLK
ncbi:uncharacterized protein LOC108158402 [Drosophila miranda]|uniref:uncharacterized protein LOC108158402 n=1 Tax=Drosophila miranda TaxID=7229 RepID=UPI0007E5E35C|nr:uncharacterized protein LOC108158402 [Drosophila miranda]